VNRLLLPLLAACATPAPPAADLTSSEAEDADVATGEVLPELGARPGRIIRTTGGAPLPGADLDARLDAAGPLLRRALRAPGLSLHRTHRLRGGGGIGVFRSEAQGLPVIEGEVKLLVDAQGRVQAWAVDPAATAGLRGPDAQLHEAEAAAAAAEACCAVALDPAAPVARPDGWLDLEAGPALSQPARVRPVAFLVDDVLRRAWQVELWVTAEHGADSHLWEVIVDAADGTALRTRSLDRHLELRVFHDEDGDLRPLDGPIEDATPHPTEIPGDWVPELIEPVLIEIEPFNAPGDPWLAEGVSTTAGNHADTYVDHAEPDGFSDGDFYAEQTAEGTFDYTYDHTLDPAEDSTQSQAAIVQSFATVQWLHDWWYDSGFDELAGNAQADNFGRGGIEGDAMKVEVQDRIFSGGRNNANMSTPSDGEQPRMQLYVWDGRSDASLTSTGGLEPDVGVASFGPDNFEETGLLAEAGSDTSACSGIDADVDGLMVLVDRGDCSFADKAATAEAAGALGVVLVNNIEAEGAPSMGGGGVPVTIPILSVSLEDGELLRDELDAGEVEVSLFRESGPALDCGLDNTVLAHEWGHYLLARLMSCGNTQCDGIHEGNADFTALHMLLREGDDLDGVYAPAAYVAAGISEDAAYYGTRRVPYSRDRAFNALSFRHITEGEELPSDEHPLSSSGSSNTGSHNVGEIWASTMFDAYLALVEDGPDAGRSFEDVRRRMSDIIVAGFTLAPSDPTFLELRDALLAAAAAEDTHDAVLMAEAFAGRGMGSCAVGPEAESDDLTGIIEDDGLGGNLAVEVPTFLDDLVSCDDDGWLDGGEAGGVAVSVSNLGGGDLTEVTVAVSFEPEPTGLVLVDGDTIILDELPAFTTTEVRFDAVLDRHEALREDTVVTVMVSHLDACEPFVTSSTFSWVETDVASAQDTTDGFDADDGSWTIEGDDDGEIWSRTDTDDDGDLLWHGLDVSGVTDSALTSPVFQLTDEDFTLDLTHRYAFETSQETFWDGSVIELSVDGGEWTDVSDWVDPGYGGTLTDTADNPLSLREAFVDMSASWPELETLSLDFGDALAGSEVQLRFRIGTDMAASDYGWEIAEVALGGLSEAVFPALVDDETDCNPAPTADAGPDQVVESGAVVALDGSGSSDPTGEPLSYSWDLDDSDDAVVVDTTGLAFTAPVVDETLVLVATLTVSDGDLEDTDTVEITVEPLPPTEEDTGGATSMGTELPPIETSGRCGCGAAPAAPAMWLLGLGLLGWRRRRPES